MAKRIGTVIHGALGDCYEQLCVVKNIRTTNPGGKWIGFFAVKERLEAMRHFELDMLDEVYGADQLPNVPVDEFYQFQINDIELRQELLDRLPDEIRNKFNFKTNILPWHVLRSIDYSKSGFGLELSQAGTSYLPLCCDLNGVTEALFTSKFTVGYLWRYRVGGGAVSPMFQKSQEWILRTKSELFNELIEKYNAHIIIAGMGKTSDSVPCEHNAAAAGVVAGEYQSKYTESRLNIPGDCCTYLKGLGYAAEMAIMSRCDLLLMMPSGFSEPLWMRRNTPAVLIDPPPVYLAKLWRHRMPFFNNLQLDYALYNITSHTKENVLKFLLRHKLLNRVSR